MSAHPIKHRKLHCLDCCGNELLTTREIIGGICLQCLGESGYRPSDDEIEALNVSLLKREHHTYM